MLTDPKFHAAKTFAEDVDAELRKIEQEKERIRQFAAHRQIRAYLHADAAPERTARPGLQKRWKKGFEPSRRRGRVRSPVDSRERQQWQATSSI